jgi:aldehyde:ferredoxin oxidoreductase
MQPILIIDLTNNKTEIISIPSSWERDYLGGASLAARILYPYLTPELDPLSPDAPLLFLTGPLTGSHGPVVGRFVVCGKGVITKLWAESNCGGFWGPELRYAGYDGLWLTGKADHPIYLWIQDGKLEIRDATHLWGQDTYQTQDSIIKEINQPHTRVAAIGPAGENLLGYAGIFCDHGRTAGRTGMGAVMGSKNLKAIAVQGSGKIPLAHPEKFAELRSQVNRDLKNDNQSQVLHDVGTAGVANYSEYLGAMPSKYFHQGAFPEVDDISGARMTDTILVGKKACHGCVIACGRVVDIGDGIKRKGPEYETVVALGSNLLIHDLKAIVRFNEICDLAGMDTISAGNTLGLALTLFEKGIITTKDTGGLELKWGDAALVEKLLGMIVNREGFGALLAEGSRALGKHFSAEEEAVQVNGLEVAAHDPRGASGMALVYATSPRGACHNQSDYFFVDWGHTEPELGIEFLPRQDGSEKAANVARHQNWRTVHNSLVMCILAGVSPQAELDLINAACSYEWTLEEMMRCGERGWNLKRMINLRLGLTAKDDRLPKPLLEPYPTGGAAGFKIDFTAMLDKYYEARGWDKATGKPSKEKLSELGLTEID